MGMWRWCAVPAASALVAVGCGADDSTGPAAEETAAVAAALDEAKDRWVDADIGDYRLTVAEATNFWSAGCTWSMVIAGGVVTESGVEAASTSSQCMPIEWTVEQLHQLVARWIDEIDDAATAPALGEHVLVAEFDDVGVPVALTYDNAGVADEESSLRVSVVPTT